MCWIVNKGSREITKYFCCNCCDLCTLTLSREDKLSSPSWPRCVVYVCQCHQCHPRAYTRSAIQTKHGVRRNFKWLCWLSTDILYDGVQAAREIQFSSASWLAGMARKIFTISSSIETQQRRWRNSGLKPYLQYGLWCWKSFQPVQPEWRGRQELWYSVRKV